MAKQYALFGAGKTGSKIPGLLHADESYTIFDSTNPPTRDGLTGFDAIISFVPGQVLIEYLDILIESGIPVISGSTGMEWPEHLHDQLQERGTTWVWAHNFALGMTIAKSLIEQLSQMSGLLTDASFGIHEVHHTAKLDAPSGTALSWQHWLGSEANISYDRIDDVIGEHELVLKTQFEEISIRHKALDRTLFANGALWATRQVLETDLPAGLLPLEFLTRMQTQGD